MNMYSTPPPGFFFINCGRVINIDDVVYIQHRLHGDDCDIHASDESYVAAPSTSYDSTSVVSPTADTKVISSGFVSRRGKGA